MDKIVFMNRDNNLLKSWNSDEYGLRVIYSAKLMGRYLVDSEPFCNADLFCDRDANEIKNCKGIPVVDHAKLSKKISDSGRKALIVIENVY